MAAPENTIPAFAKAVAFGANAIETDVCVTQDDRFILWHDADPNGVVALARQWGGEGLPYIPAVPALGSPWRQPVRKMALAVLRKYYRYIRRTPVVSDSPEEPHLPQAIPTVFEDLVTWLSHERRLQHVFLDLKFAPGELYAALSLLERLYGLYDEREGFRPDLTFHLMSPHREIVEALLRLAQHRPLPKTLRLYADFEWPGVRPIARRLGVRHIAMGYGVRAWHEFRHEVAQVVAARNRGRFDTVIAWTVNDAARLRELVRLGVDGIMTDDPALLGEIVREYRQGSSQGFVDQRTPAGEPSEGVDSA